MKFATFINFTDQGIRDIDQTTRRAAAFSQQAAKAGLEISEMLWLSGRFDGLMVYEAPDPETAGAAMLRLSKTGNVKTETLQAFDSTGMQQVLDKI